MSGETVEVSQTVNSVTITQASGPTVTTASPGPQGPQGVQGPAGSGFNFVGAFSSGGTYATADIVTYLGSSYICILATSGSHIPTNSTYWSVLAQKGEAASYVFTQGSPSATWTIVHNLGVFPSVTVVDSGGSVQIGDVLYVSANEITLTFSAAFAGKAYLN
jgi:hypothetical protein